MIKNNNMMKKLCLLVLIMVLGKISYSQYPVQQFIGADSAVVTSKGGLQGRLINTVYSDTGAANLQRIRQYPGAQIVTNGAGMKIWLRNNDATRWLQIPAGSGVGNIYTIDGTLTGNRELDGDGYGLNFEGVRRFSIGGDTVFYNVPYQQYRSLTQDFILSDSLAKLVRSGAATVLVNSTNGSARLVLNPDGPMDEKKYEVKALNEEFWIAQISDNETLGDTIFFAGNNRVGIKTNNPRTGIELKDNTYVAGQFAAGDTINAAGTYAIQGATFSPYVFSRKAVDTLQSSDPRNIAVLGQTIARGPVSNRLVGGAFFTQTDSSNSQNISQLRALQGWTIHNGTGTVTNAWGSYNVITNNQTGTITNAYGSVSGVENRTTGYIPKLHGQSVEVWNLGGGAIDTVFGQTVSIYNSNPASTIGAAYGVSIGKGMITNTGGTHYWRNSGTIGTSYGLYLDSSIDVGINKYSIYSFSNSPSYFRGSLGLGTSSPDSMLTVTNGALFQRGVRMSGLPAAQGTKALRIDANGTISTADTLIDAGGTVTSVATNNGTGITGGTITTTGTIAADTLLLSTRAWRQKGIDSVAALANGKINGTLLSGYLTKATGSLTIDTSQLYQSNGLIGIGTTSPTQKLQVNGDALINTLRVGRGGGNLDGNTAFGYESLNANTTGQTNTAIGWRSLKNNTSGSNNISIGQNAMANSTNVNQNIAIGNDAMLNNTSASILNNIAIGYQSLINNTGDNNVAIGNISLASKTTGNQNVALGGQAGYYSSGTFTGGQNVYIGYQAFPSGASVSNEIAIGSTTTGNGSNSVTLGNTSITKTILRANVGIGTTAPDSALQVVNGAYFQRGIRASGLPAAPGTKALRIDANGTISTSDTLIDAGGTVTSVATNNGTGITGGTITTTGTLAIDTLLVSTRAWRQKGIDSVAALLPAAISGTTNYIPKFTSSSAIGNSVIYESGGSIGIGTITPQTLVELYSGTEANLRLHSGGAGGDQASIYVKKGAGNGLIFGEENRDFIWQTGAGSLTNGGGSERMRLDASGNLGLGTSSPSSKLNVSGGNITVSDVVSPRVLATGNTATGFPGYNLSNTTQGYEIIVRGNQSNTFQIRNSTASTDLVIIDPSGNLGLGVTPSAWGASYKAIQISSYASITQGGNDTYIGNNWYNDGTNKYLQTNAASLYGQSTGRHIWYTAPSGTAGNAISFTQAMTLFSTGNLAVGGTSDNGSRLNVTGAATFSSSVTATQGVFSGSAAERVRMTRTSIGSWDLAISGDNRFSIYDVAGGVERLAITSGGNVGIGTTSPNGKLDVNTGTGATLRVTSGGTNILNVTNYSTADGFREFLLGGSEISFYSGTAGGGSLSERMRITSGGNVGIGTSNPSTKLEISGTGNQYIQTTATDGSNAGIRMNAIGQREFGIFSDGALRFYDFTASTERMRITSGGDLLIATTTDAGAYPLQVNGSVYATSYFESSDLRLKNVLSEREGSDGINTIIFKWKDGRDSLTHIGYAAQQVEKVLPDAVKTNTDGYKTVNYDEVQSLKIANLEKEVKELKELINKLIEKK